MARHIVSAPQRHGQQAQTLGQPLARSRVDAQVREALDWVCEHLHTPLDLAAAAQRADLSPRSFTRHLRQITGTTYAQWLLHQRLQRTQALLQGGDSTIEAIATQVGFATSASLRQHFRREFGLSPLQYRQATRAQLPDDGFSTMVSHAA